MEIKFVDEKYEPADPAGDEARRTKKALNDIVDILNNVLGPDRRIDTVDDGWPAMWIAARGVNGKVYTAGIMRVGMNAIDSIVAEILYHEEEALHDGS